MTWAIAVHGGAGEVEDEREMGARAGCEAAVAAGQAVLEAGGTALDAVCAAVRVLEDDERFNAGRGAVFNRAGQIEHDAAVMTDGLRVGACGAVYGVRNPIDLARAVLEDGEHVLLVGEGARAFAAERGLAAVPRAWHETERQRERLQRELEKRGLPPVPGTVGAVARDDAGRVAAATSTGGVSGKRPGRVGDTPLPGCGTWAEAGRGAASATGPGEAIIRCTMARIAVDRLADGADAGAAARAAVAEVEARTGQQVGIIMVGAHGPAGIAHATRRMSFATASAGGQVVSGITMITPR
ncbi:MAG: isoaspartyl peptidase/L-asparaginase [Deltaproteobacteria bacterium]|nr:isoaspartyl peptidase/L-asparaginase [Deltaproteobacteria bacterium]